MEIAKVTKMAIQAAVAFQSTRGIIVLLFLLYLAAATACKHIIEKGDAKSKAEDFADAPEDADTGVLQEA